MVFAGKLRVKKRWWALAILTVAVASSPVWLGFGLWRIADALQVSASMGAKLGCSGHFISGQDNQQILQDLTSYSPANSLLELHYSSSNVAANLLGIRQASATYRPGLGCTLDIGDTQPLDRLQLSSAKADLSPGLPQQISASWQSKLDDLLAADNAKGLDSRALLLVKDGKLVAESYARGYNAYTPLLGWSMAKSVTAIMQGRMQQLGLVNENNMSLFDEWRSDRRASIRLSQLLQMTSGLDFDETYAPGTDAANMLFIAHDASALPLHSDIAYEPGRHFAYSSGTTNVIMRYLNQQLGGNQAALDFLYQELVQPLGLSHFYLETDPSGVFVGSSYLYASGRDWASLGQLLLNNGNWQGQQLLNKEWLFRATQPNSSENDDRYGYQLWLNAGRNKAEDARRWPQLPADAYAMLGNRKQVVMVIPSWNLVFVRLGWSKSDYPTAENISALMH